jgi:hypothetical protein
MLEAVQRRATKQIPGMKDLSYPERLRKLKLPTLSYRRVRGDMIELYKITHQITDSEACTFIVLWKDTSVRNSGRGNSLTIFPKRATTTIRNNYFAFSAAPVWNSLPEWVVTAKTTNSFKNRLDKCWSKQEIVYDDVKATITTTSTGSHKSSE